MKVTEFKIEGLKLIELDVFSDNRGFFVERYNAVKFDELGIPSTYIQDNFSRSNPGVLRGLHYQTNPNQAKLVGCTSGKIFDVAVDLRKGSKTYGQYESVILSGDDNKIFYIPAGFAHGFCVLGDIAADVMYKVDSKFSSSGDTGIAYNDPDINIDWPISSPILSEKDKGLKSFASYDKKPDFILFL